MTFVFFCCGTIVLSFILDLKNGTRVYKDMADLGYKIDSKRYSEIQKQLAPDDVKVNFLTLCIPFYNIFAVYYKTLQYSNTRNTAYDELNALGVLEEMNDLEKKNYAKRPTGFNALFGPLILEIKLMGAHKVSINDGDIKGDIYYKFVKSGKSNVKVKIVETTVDTEKLSLDDQKRILNEARKMVNENSAISAFTDKIIKGTDIYGRDEYLEKVRNNESADIDKPIDVESLSFERRKQIEELEKFKEFVLNKQTEKSDTQEIEEKGQSYIKK